MPPLSVTTNFEDLIAAIDSRYDMGLDLIIFDGKSKLFLIITCSILG